MLIRKMTLKDAPAVYAMGEHETGFRVSKSSCFWSIKQLETWIETDEDVLLVAEAEGEIAGFVLTTLHKPTGKVTWENQLVIPKYRGQGVAQALIHEMEIQLKAKGAIYLHFLIREGNPARDWYRQMGFRAGCDCIWFEKPL